MALIVKRFENTNSEGIQTSSLSPTITDFREVVLHPLIAQRVAIKLELWKEARFVASIAMRWDTLLLNAISQGKSRIPLMI